MVPGAIAGALGWTLLQYLGGVLVEHSLRNTSKEYGAFALVLGLIAFLYLAAEVTLYAAEVNVVRVRHLWPRAVVQPALTAADKEVLSSIALKRSGAPSSSLRQAFVRSTPEGTDDRDGRALSDDPFPPGDDGYRRAYARRRHLSHTRRCSTWPVAGAAG